MSDTNAKDKYILMTTTPVEPLILKLSVPTIISMLVSSFYNMADTYFVGKVSTEATAAVGVVFSLMAIIQAIGFYFGHGSGNYISRQLGKKNVEKADFMASTAFFSTFFAGILLLISGCIFVKPLALLLGATPTILNDVVDYMQIILIGAPFTMSSFVLNNQLRYQGNAAYAMIGIVAGAAINIGLDPLFIFVFDMGVRGAALATVISQTISFILLLIGMNKGSIIKLSIKKFKFDFYYQAQIFKGGLPSLLRQGLASVSTMLLNHVAGSYSDAAIAGISVVTRVSMFANSALIGFGQGFQPIVGFNYGAKLYDRVKKGFWFCVKVATGFLVTVSVLGFIFSEGIISAFRNDPEVIRVGSFTLRAYAIAFPLNSIIVMSNMMFQSSGKTIPASLMASARQGLFLIPVIYIMNYFFGLRGLQLAQCITDYCSFFLAIPLLINYLKKF